MMNIQKKYGLIGETLKHSFSQKHFSNKFDKEGVSACYLNFELKNISEVKDVFGQVQIEGLNVTIPYKEKIIPYLDSLSDEANEIGAVNTIAFIDGKKVGHNTDVFGFRQMLKPFFKSHHERSMVIGTGGASKAVAYVLEKLGSEVIYISRNPTGENQFSYDEINENMIKFCGLIVNTTPVGMFPQENELVNIPYEHLTNKHLVIDLIYNPKETQFLKKAKENGAVILNGETMLVQQAEESWRIWNNK